MNRVLAAGIVVGVVALVLAPFAEVDPAAQVASTPVAPTPTPAPFLRSSLLARAELDVLAEGPATVSVTFVTLARGAGTEPFTSTGTTIIIVDDGAILLDADAAEIGTPNISAIVGIEPISTVEAASDVYVPEDWQVVLPPGATAEVRNATDEPTTLYLFVLAPQS